MHILLCWHIRCIASGVAKIFFDNVFKLRKMPKTVVYKWYIYKFGRSYNFINSNVTLNITKSKLPQRIQVMTSRWKIVRVRWKFFALTNRSVVCLLQGHVWKCKGTHWMSQEGRWRGRSLKWTLTWSYWCYRIVGSLNLLKLQIDPTVHHNLNPNLNIMY